MVKGSCTLAVKLEFCMTSPKKKESWVDRQHL